MPLLYYWREIIVISGKKLSSRTWTFISLAGGVDANRSSRPAMTQVGLAIQIQVQDLELMVPMLTEAVDQQ